MAKITTKEVRRGIERQNIKLVKDATFKYEPFYPNGPIQFCGCPLAILYFENHMKAHNLRVEKQLLSGVVGADLVEDMIMRWAYRKYGGNFVSGFIDGFDDQNNKGYFFDSVIHSKNKDYKEGKKEGERIRGNLL